MSQNQDFTKMKYTELYQHAKDLGLNPPGGLTKEKLIEMIREGTAAPETVTGELLAKSDRVTITILESSDKNAVNPVFIGVNGIGYSIRRGVPVPVPRSVVEVLENARQTVFEATNDENGALVMRPRSALSYPYTING